MGWLIAMYFTIAVIIFVLCVLALDSSWRDEKERKVIGWLGLSAPIWPVSVLALLVAGFYLCSRYMWRVVRGRE